MFTSLMLGVDRLGKVRLRKPTDIDQLSSIFSSVSSQQKKKHIVHHYSFWSAAHNHTWHKNGSPLQKKHKHHTKPSQKYSYVTNSCTFVMSRKVWYWQVVTEYSVSANISILHYSLHFIFPSFIPRLEAVHSHPLALKRKSLSLSLWLSAAQLSWWRLC